MVPFAYSLGEGVEAVLPARSRQDVVAGRGEVFGDGFADTAAGAGDQYDLGTAVVAHVHPSSRWLVASLTTVVPGRGPCQDGLCLGVLPPGTRGVAALG